MNKIFFDTSVKIICIFLFIVSCSKSNSNQKEILAFQENSNISDEEALYGISRIIFGDMVEIEPTLFIQKETIQSEFNLIQFDLF